MSETKASLDRKGEGRKLRRARNVVKKWLASADPPLLGTPEFRAVWSEIERNRFERAQVLLVTAALLKD